MPDELSQRVIAVMAATQHVAADTITIDSTFQELGFDSLDGINIVFALENEFDISIPDEEARNLRSVREVVDGVGQLIAAKGEAAQA